MFLSKICKEAGLTQKQLAEALQVEPSSLSELESLDDLSIGLLRRIVHAMGGQLELVIHLPRADIRICRFQD